MDVILAENTLRYSLASRISEPPLTNFLKKFDAGNPYFRRPPLIIFESVVRSSFTCAINGVVERL